jgi:putative ABC transport system substrate-binding protein
MAPASQGDRTKRDESGGPARSNYRRRHWPVCRYSSRRFGHPDVIVAAAERHELPAVYSQPYYVTAGGLVCYGHDVLEDYRRAAGYVDRILKGAKPADLPVQAPTKYELTINLKAAKAIGLSPPTSVLGRADEVIE